MRTQPHTVVDKSTQQPANTSPIKAVYPTLTTEAMAKTMEAYRYYIAKYNDEVSHLNKWINDYNNSLSCDNLTTVQESIRLAFFTENGRFASKKGNKQWQRSSSISVHEYNAMAHEHNTSFNTGIPLECLQPVRSDTEQVFMQIVYEYRRQLQLHTTALRQFNIVAKSPVKGVVVNSGVVAKARRYGIKVLNYCTKTIRNHRQRLEESGVLSYVAFLGRNKGVEMDINPQILHILDEKTGKITTSRNQRLTAEEWKVLPHIYYEYYKNYKNKEKIKENVDNNSLRKASDKSDKSSTLDSSSEKKAFDKSNNENKLQERILQEHPKQVVDFETKKSPPPKIGRKNARFADTTPTTASPKTKPTKKMLHRAKILDSYIEDPIQLCRDLAEGNYNDYKPLDIRILTAEAYWGVMTREEFHDLMVQEIMRQSAKIWRNKTVHIGSWINAYKTLKNRYLLYHNNLPYHKNFQVEILSEIRWRLNHAQRYFLKNKDFNPLFPSQYFDKTRKDHREGGFEYTRRAWQRKLKYEADKDIAKAIAERKAQLRAKKINAHKNISFKIKQYVNNKITLESLYDFMQSQHPEYIPKIGDMLSKYLSTYN